MPRESQVFRILDREFRFGVTPDKVDRLRFCCEELDKRMRAVRAQGRVLGYDQIATFVALDLIWDLTDRNRIAADKIEKVKERCEAALGQLDGDGSNEATIGESQAIPPESAKQDP